MCVLDVVLSGNFSLADSFTALEQTITNTDLISAVVRGDIVEGLQSTLEDSVANVVDESETKSLSTAVLLIIIVSSAVTALLLVVLAAVLITKLIKPRLSHNKTSPEMFSDPSKIHNAPKF